MAIRERQLGLMPYTRDLHCDNEWKPFDYF